MSSHIYEVTVLGAGIEGSATAYHLAKNKHDTLLLEQVRICDDILIIVFQNLENFMTCQSCQQWSC